MMTFSDDIAGGMAEFSKFCLLHDLDSADVLWANNRTAADIVPGTQICLPTSRAGLLAIWQRSQNPYYNNAPQAPAEGQPAKVTQDQPSTRKDVPAPRPAAAKPSAATQQPRTSAPGETGPEPPKKTSPPEPEAPAKNEPQEPILFLSPEGDPTSGPMKLVISGDNVLVVRLPKSAAPRTPSLADLNRAFPPSLLPESGAAPKPRAAKPTDTKMLWPVIGIISSPFGKRGEGRHDGIDIPMPRGTPVRAARDGVVRQTGTNKTPGFRGYGNFVLLDHGGGVMTLYAHCDSISVKPGQRLRQGQTVARVGNTGRASTDHLHFEIRINGKPADPLAYLPPNPAAPAPQKTVALQAAQKSARKAAAEPSKGKK